MPRPPRDPSGIHEAILAALEDVAGASLVLDDELRVVAATSGAEALIGAPIDLGVSAPKLLCGTGKQRPIAEALAAGRPVTAEVPRPAPGGGMRLVHVRAAPLADGGTRVGWLLLLDAEAWEADAPDAPVEVHGILTRDPGMKRLLRDIERVARKETTVLVRGETGTGKELVAHAIHEASPRAKGPFRAINCAALPPQLLESELFGHVRGAFTGAVRDSPGHFRLASGGTLFLDEVAELSGDLQAKLLRVLQERTVIPVGGRDPVPVDVRIVSATHRSLRDAVARGKFRDDLMYRLRVVPLFLPALRARPADIELLAMRFVEQHNAQGGRTVVRISSGAVRLLEAYDWPGNVRELQNAIEYAFVMGDGSVLTEAELPPEVRGEVFEDRPLGVNVPELPHDGAETLSDEARRIVYALERAAGHRGRAAASLGMSRSTLWRRMKEYGLDRTD